MRNGHGQPGQRHDGKDKEHQPPSVAHALVFHNAHPSFCQIVRDKFNKIFGASGHDTQHQQEDAGAKLEAMVIVLVMCSVVLAVLLVAMAMSVP